MARSGRALQADGDRGGMGGDPPASYYDRVHRGFRTHREIAVGRERALPANGLRRYVAMDVFRDRSQRGRQQPDQQCQPDQQGILPKADRAHGDSRRRVGRLPDHVFDADRADGMVPVPARLADAGSAGVYPVGVPRQQGSSLWITALNVKYRDFRYVIPFLVQFGLYVSPVGFSSNVVPDQWRLLYSLNPMVAVIDGFRWCLLGGQSVLFLPGVAIGAAVAAFFLWFGIRRFRRTEASFADLI